VKVESCSGEAMLLWGVKVALRGNVTRGRQMLLWGVKVALGRQCCSGEKRTHTLGKYLLLWGVKVALGSESCSEGQCCSGE